MILLQTLFLGSEIRKGLKDHTKIRKVLKGVLDNWSYHCLYFQTPGQLEDFFKLESCLLDISTKVNSSTRKTHLLRYSYFKFKIWKQNICSLLKQVPSWSCDYHFLIFAVEIHLRGFISSYKSSAKTYIWNISTINAQSLCTSQSRVRL